MMITIIKQNHQGEEVLRYTGELVLSTASSACIRAPFTLSSRDLGYLQLNTGDLFTEWFYTDRWYNVFQIRDGLTDELKGYYCNITRPAVITQDTICAEDLAMDVFVFPDGRMQILDQEEYKALHLSDAEQEQVQQALRQIVRCVNRREAPFNDLWTI